LQNNSGQNNHKQPLIQTEKFSDKKSDTNLDSRKGREGRKGKIATREHKERKDISNRCNWR
jgi:hypothetical protein